MTRPSRIVGAVIAVADGNARGHDTVRRAWWRGERLTRVVLKHGGERHVERVERESDAIAGLRVLWLRRAR